ncbi:MAG: PilN domain-containing protein [Methylococcaceae bacterium]|nr:PilN domain-containing protein [Methylococcaceae bacterium]
MAKINLLPWRDELRKQQQQNFLLAILGSAGVAMLIMFMVHSHIEGLIDQQNHRNRFLETEIAALDKKIKEIEELEDKKRKFIAKMEVIQQLQGSRPEIVHLFEEIATTTPDGLYLTEMKQAGPTLTFDGAAQSNARVSAYMRNLESSPWLANPVLTIIETKGSSNQGRVSRFELKVQQKKQDQENDGGKS